MMESTLTSSNALPPASTVAKHLAGLARKTECVLETLKSKLSSAEDVYKFFQEEHKTKDRLGATKDRGDTFTALSVTSMKELEELVEKYKENDSVQRAFEELQEVDRKWDIFVEELEARLEAIHPHHARGYEYLNVGKHVSEQQKQMLLTNYSSQQKNTLGELISCSQYTLLSFFLMTG